MQVIIHNYYRHSFTSSFMCYTLCKKMKTDNAPLKSLNFLTLSSQPYSCML